MFLIFSPIMITTNLLKWYISYNCIESSELAYKYSTHSKYPHSHLLFHFFILFKCSSNPLSCYQTLFSVNALHHLWNIYSKLELMPKETHLGWSHAVTFIDRNTKPAAQKPFGTFTYIIQHFVFFLHFACNINSTT